MKKPILYFIYFGLLVSIISCVKKEQEPFLFVQMCDTQLGIGGYEHDVKNFEQAVIQINEINPDFVVICGDLVHHANDSSYADFNRIMGEFKIPCYPAPGNHRANRASVWLCRRLGGPIAPRPTALVWQALYCARPGGARLGVLFIFCYRVGSGAGIITPQNALPRLA